MEQTFFMIKSDALQRRLAGRVLTRIEEKGLRICALRLLRMSPREAGNLYSVHKGKPYYGRLIRFITSSPVIVGVAEGLGAVAVLRKLLGATHGAKAEPGTIRGDFGTSETMNLVHGADSVKSARREISIFFKKSEITRYKNVDLEWITTKRERE
jgi:nucleoside-diphosphate kinase